MQTQHYRQTRTDRKRGAMENSEMNMSKSNNPHSLQKTVSCLLVSQESEFVTTI